MTVSAVLVARLHAAVGERLDEREARDEAEGEAFLTLRDKSGWDSDHMLGWCAGWFWCSFGA